MAFAIDRKEIVDKIFMGIPNLWAFLAPYELGYDPDLKPYPYDPKRAKELLAEAGYPNGFDLKFYWPITGRWPMAREMAETVASYFNAIGIRTKLIGQEWGVHYSMVRASKGPKAEFVGIWGGASGAVDPTFFLDMFFSSDGGMSVHYNPEFDKIVAKAKATMDNAKRGELIKKAVRMSREDVASIPIYSTIAIYATKENIDFRPTQKYLMDLILVKDITIK
jgi:peptide/nickel transport system substrate-binding protein